MGDAQEARAISDEELFGVDEWRSRRRRGGRGRERREGDLCEFIERGERWGREASGEVRERVRGVFPSREEESERGEGEHGEGEGVEEGEKEESAAARFPVWRVRRRRERRRRERREGGQ